MRNLTREDLIHLLDKKIFHQISEVADEQGVECYVVGGYVRDLFLERPSQDIDIVTVGSGIALAKALAGRLGRGAHLSVFSNFGTAQVKFKGMEVELVGAGRRVTAMTRVSRWWKTGRWKTTRTAVISRLMHWPYV